MLKSNKIQRQKLRRNVIEYWDDKNTFETLLSIETVSDVGPDDKRIQRQELHRKVIEYWDSFPCRFRHGECFRNIGTG